MRVLAAAAMLTLLTVPTVPVFAQSVGSRQESPLDDMLDRPQKDKEAAREKAYQDALKSIKPDAPPKTDPWGNVRAQDAGQSKQKVQPK
jgi:hypothetical protein